VTAAVAWGARVALAALALAVASGPAPALAPAVVPPPTAYRITKFTIPTATQATHFGTVALSDDRLVVGAVGHRYFRGAVHVFDRASGDHVSTILKPHGEAYESFGNAVCIDGDAVLVGAPGVGEAGYAGRYVLATGCELREYVAMQPVPGGEFGAQVVCEGDVVAVGAPGGQPFPPDEGVVHRFDRVTGTPLGSITSPAPTGIFGPTHHLGGSLAVEEGILAVGAPGTDFVGAAYLYDLATGSRRQVLEPPAASPPGAFGSSVAMGGGRVAVGDPGAAGHLGAVHVYDARSGTRLYSVVNASGQPGKGYGASVALDATRLVVGETHGTLGAAEGLVHVYDAVTGAPQDVLTGYPAATTHTFGGVLDLHGGALAVGDVQDDEVAIYAGAAYLVSFP
jgi:hypothetical protein